VEVSPVTLEGQHVRLEPLSTAHEESLIAAASDGELWNSTVTVVPSRATMAAYIQVALEAQAQGHELPFVIIRKRGTGVRGPQRGSPAGVLDPPVNHAQDVKTLDGVVGTTRFYDIKPTDRRVVIGYTWLSASAQRTSVNTESKLLLLTHAFEQWRCIRVEFITDVLNQKSRTAILRLGAKQEGILRNHMIMPNGRIRDSVCFSTITEEWSEVKARLAAKLGAVARP
jgi:RimJ/RimL family protein N-acetyltransferase